jgi:hypothetical protein
VLFHFRSVCKRVARPIADAASDVHGYVGFSVAPALASSNTPSELSPSRSIMPAKEEYKAKPSSKSEKNKPKGGAAKDAEREKKKAKDAEKALRK